MVAAVHHHFDPMPIVGGSAGDDLEYKATWVFEGGKALSGAAALLIFEMGGVPFRTFRLQDFAPISDYLVVTEADPVQRIVYELDGEPALDLYKRYLGAASAELPASGLSFPLAVRDATGEPVVRTILAIDEAARSLTFAGDVPTGHRARLMKANVDGLVAGAAGAAATSVEAAPADSPDLAILISCVGRKLVMKQRTEDELEAVRDALGARTAITGFYSYGEIAPWAPAAPCALHNQTMTVTTLFERESDPSAR